MKIAAFMIALVLAGTACDRAPTTAAGGEISSDQFVDVYVNLMRAQRPMGSATDFERRKQKVLKDAGVTEEHLEQFIQTHAGDITLMATVWDTIQTRIARISATTGTIQ